ncbi:MAG: hypothetical protein H7Z10_05235 [Gemmatimonadaceae bacterium]|nr:hypothetical protein [Acetobacteraceae bacterium]
MRTTLAAAIMMLVAGCTPPPPPAPPGDPRVFLTPDAGVFADPPIVAFGPELRGSVRLVNPGPNDRPVIQTTEWANASGMPVRSLLSTPQRLTVPRFGDATIQVIAPSRAAVQFRIRVEPDLYQ